MVKHGYRDELMHIQATDYEFLVGYGRLCKAGFAAGEESPVIAGFILLVMGFYGPDRKRAIRWLTAQADDYNAGHKEHVNKRRP
jgi:hypothetical protein